jgi:Ulp1 protease family, C-terminal catalytic domain
MKDDLVDDAATEQAVLMNSVRARQALSSIPNGEKLKNKLLPPNTPVRPTIGTDQKKLQLSQISDITIPPFNTDERPRRITRQMQRSHRDVSPLVGPGSQTKFNLGPTWPTPLVYQGPGKKRAVVDFEDLERLNESEFLNDNLIEFYLNWLQSQNPTEQNEVHFFSTHFYSALTSKRSRIDHKAVERWTRGVDIFTYDFVVIPVNEALHWYLAIICNLRNIERRAPGTEATPVQIDDSYEEIDDSTTEVVENKRPQGSNSLAHLVFDVMKSKSEGEGPVASEGKTRQSSLEQKTSHLDISENDHKVVDAGTPNQKDQQGNSIGERQEPANRIGQTARNAKKGKARAAPAPRKYPVTEPTIVIVDSLGVLHPNTSRNLKDYLVAEAEVRRGLSVSKDELKGFHAKKGIPQQSNFADCGLYLCAYIEKFIKNPRKFANKLLSQEFNLHEDWDINSSQMRNEIRSTLMKLHDEQEAQKSTQKGEKKATKKNGTIQTKETLTLQEPQPEPTVQVSRTPEPSPKQCTTPPEKNMIDLASFAKEEDEEVEASTKSPVSPSKVEANRDNVAVPSTPQVKVTIIPQTPVLVNSTDDVGQKAVTINKMQPAGEKARQEDHDPIPPKIIAKPANPSASAFFNVSSTPPGIEATTAVISRSEAVSMRYDPIKDSFSYGASQLNQLEASLPGFVTDPIQAAADLEIEGGKEYRVEFIPETPPQPESTQCSQANEQPAQVASPSPKGSVMWSPIEIVGERRTRRRQTRAIMKDDLKAQSR